MKDTSEVSDGGIETSEMMDNEAINEHNFDEEDVKDNDGNNFVFII